jgi:hypothetical protein
VISKLFDKDGDGKLNAEERKAADEAIKNVSFNFNFRASKTITFGTWSRLAPKGHSESCRSVEYLLMLKIFCQLPLHILSTPFRK